MTISKFVLDGSTLTVNTLVGLARTPGMLELGQEARNQIKACRHDLMAKLDGGARIYGRFQGRCSYASSMSVSHTKVAASQDRVLRATGCNTGMGGFVGTDIPSNQIRALQENVIAAVQTNVGPFLPDEVDVLDDDQYALLAFHSFQSFLCCRLCVLPWCAASTALHRETQPSLLTLLTILW